MDFEIKEVNQENNKNKKGKKLIIILISIIVLLILVVGGLLFSNEIKAIFNDDLEKTSNEVEEEKEPVAKTQMDTSDLNAVITLVNKYELGGADSGRTFHLYYDKNGCLTSGAGISDYSKCWYGDSVLTLDEMNENYVRQLAISTGSETYNGATATKEQYDNGMKTLFGDFYLEPAEIKFNYGWDDHEFTIYNYANETFTEEGATYGPPFEYTLEIVKKITDVSQTDTTMEVELAVGQKITNHSIEGLPSEFYANIIAQDLFPVKDDFNIETDYNLLDKYKYVFNFDNVTGNYTLKEIQIVLE